MASDNRGHLAVWLGGIALGAVAMYVADPAHGKRRRELAQEKIHKAGRKAEKAWQTVRRDAGSRLQGLQSQTDHWLGKHDVKPIDDHVLEARVSSKIGRKVSNWHAIDVDAHLGCVTLRGPILTEEKESMLEMVRGIPGVLDVRDELDVYDDPDNIPDLQDYYASPRRGPSRHDKWSPGARLMAAIGGGLIGYYGITRRNTAGSMMVAAGLGLLARSLGNYEDLKGMIASERDKNVRVQKSIEINASPEKIFDAWSRYENFPQFMSYVVDVKDLGQGRSHWMVKGPLGMSYEWNSIVTESRQPSVLAWKSEPGAEIENSGSVRMVAANGGTRVTVELCYCPPGGALGEGVAALMGRSPEQELESDLMRMKEFIEQNPASPENPELASTQGQVLH